jgi:hypothetical protein
LIEHKVANDRTGYGIPRIVLVLQPLYDSLTLLLVFEDDQEVALVREVQLEPEISISTGRDR